MSASRLVRSSLVALATAATVLGLVSTASASAPGVVYVSPSHGPATSSALTGSSQCRTTSVHSIQQGVTTVATGGTVIVCPGIYREEVNILNVLTLKGLPGAVIDATGLSYGIGIGQLHVTVTGMTVKNAGVGLTGCQADESAPQCDGILTAAFPPDPFTSGHLTLSNNLLVGNVFAGIDVNDTFNTLVTHNVAVNNGIGINVDDDVSSDIQQPVHDNQIIGNVASHNAREGIRLADSAGFGGPLSNGLVNTLVKQNIVLGNGGAGLLLAAPSDQGFLSNNVFTGNLASGNGQAGFALHLHPSNATVTGTSVVGNDFGTNNTKGDLKDPVTTAGYLGSNAPLTITVTNNRVHDDRIGLFQAGPITTVASGNQLTNVAHPFVAVATYGG